MDWDGMMRSWIDLLDTAADDFGFRVEAGRFYFLRHGETGENHRHICQGQDDVPLNQHGLAQAQRSARLLACCGIEKIVSSDLSRVRRTIEPLVELTGWPVMLDAGLRERGFGVLEGHPIPDDLWDRRDSGVEPVDGFAVRVLQSAQRAVSAENVLIAAHGGILRVLSAALDLRLQSYAFANAQPLIFTKRAGGFAVDGLFDEGVFDATRPLPDHVQSPTMTTGALIAQYSRRG